MVSTKMLPVSLLIYNLFVLDLSVELPISYS